LYFVGNDIFLLKSYFLSVHSFEYYNLCFFSPTSLFFVIFKFFGKSILYTQSFSFILSNQFFFSEYFNFDFSLFLSYDLAIIKFLYSLIDSFGAFPKVGIYRKVWVPFLYISYFPFDLFLFSFFDPFYIFVKVYILYFMSILFIFYGIYYYTKYLLQDYLNNNIVIRGGIFIVVYFLSFAFIYF